MFPAFSMFSMFSQLTPCSPIRDGRMEQFVKPCLCLIQPSSTNLFDAKGGHRIKKKKLSKNHLESPLTAKTGLHIVWAGGSPFYQTSKKNPIRGRGWGGPTPNSKCLKNLTFS